MAAFASSKVLGTRKKPPGPLQRRRCLGKIYKLNQQSSTLMKEIILHALGTETRVMKECIPNDKKSQCVFISRIYVLLWIAIISFAILINSFSSLPFQIFVTKTPPVIRR